MTRLPPDDLAELDRLLDDFVADLTVNDEFLGVRDCAAVVRGHVAHLLGGIS